MFEKELKDTYLIPSLNGKYIYKRFGSVYSLPSNEIIEIYNLSFSYRSVIILGGVSLEISEGERLAIIPVIMEGPPSRLKWPL